MFVRIQQLLSKEDQEKVAEIIATGSFVDGSATAGGPTKKVKYNQQLDLAAHPEKEALLRLITQVMNSHSAVRSAAVPRHMTAPMISKYQPGMSYGWHIDNAIMPGIGRPVRSDVACTIFLSDSKDYDGGELVVRSVTGDVKIKLEKGDAVLYPASQYHHVTEVTRGERLAIVFWIQSMIADMGKRELLYDLEMAYDRVLKDNPDSEALRMIQRAQSNLIRRWSDL